MSYVEYAGVTLKVVNPLEESVLARVKNIIESNEKYLSETETSWAGDATRFLKKNYEVLGSGACGIVIAIDDNHVLKFNYTSSYTTNDGKALELLQGAPMTLELFLYSDDNRYLVIERVHGEELNYIDRLDLSQATKEQLANVELYEESFHEFLRACVRVGVKPNDLHSGNIMLTTEGDFKIVDYGLFRDGNAGLKFEYLQSDCYSYIRGITNICKQYRQRIIEKAMEQELIYHSEKVEEVLREAGLGERDIRVIVSQMKNSLIETELEKVASEKRKELNRKKVESARRKFDEFVEAMGAPQEKAFQRVAQGLKGLAGVLPKPVPIKLPHVVKNVVGEINPVGELVSKSTSITSLLKGLLSTD